MALAAREGGEGEAAVAPAPAAASSEGGAASVPALTSEEQTLAEWLAQGPYTLALSSSFFGYYAHAGALQARPQPQQERSQRAPPSSQRFRRALRRRCAPPPRALAARSRSRGALAARARVFRPRSPPSSAAPRHTSRRVR